MSDSEKYIRVEIFSHEEAERLRKEMDLMDLKHRQDLDRVNARIDGLHRLVHELMEVLGSIRNKR